MCFVESWEVASETQGTQPRYTLRFQVRFIKETGHFKRNSQQCGDLSMSGRRKRDRKSAPKNKGWSVRVNNWGAVHRERLGIRHCDMAASFSDSSRRTRWLTGKDVTCVRYQCWGQSGSRIMALLCVPHCLALPCPSQDPHASHASSHTGSIWDLSFCSPAGSSAELRAKVCTEQNTAL